MYAVSATERGSTTVVKYDVRMLVFEVTSNTNMRTSYFTTVVDPRSVAETAYIKWIDYMRSPASTSFMTISLSVGGVLELKPWSDLFDRQAQVIKNKNAISLLRSWIREAEDIDENELRDLEQIKIALDSDRTSSRKLFP